MRPYEVVLILDSAADETAVDAVVGRVKDNLSANDGKVGQVEKWGRRRFAYEMNHRWDGYYTLVEFSSDPKNIAALDRMLLLSDDVLRHKIVRVPESVAGRAGKASSPDSVSAAASKSETADAAAVSTGASA